MNTYDEFGNYIGPELDVGSSDDPYSADEEEDQPMAEPEPAQATALATASEERPGDLPEVIVHEEDTQAITEPIIAPQKVNTFDVLERDVPETTFSYEFMQGLMQHPSLVRHVSFVGHLHHGKTSLVDMLVMETHTLLKPIGQILDEDGNLKSQSVTGPNRLALRSRNKQASTRELRFTDSRIDEQERGISIKASPVSLVLPDSRGKSYLMHIMDTPGHINFVDEAVAALRISDGAVLCVDLLEGCLLTTRKVVEAIIRAGSDAVLVLTCLDRLILELRLPPTDAFHKIRYVLGQVNELMQTTAATLGRPAPRVFSPATGNVLFASGRYSFLFSLQSFARIYQEKKLLGSEVDYLGAGFDCEKFAKFLWGDIWFNAETRKFQKTRPESMSEDEDEPRSFVKFVLEPIYKIIGHVVAEEKPTLKPTLEELDIYLEEDDYLCDTQTLLKKVGHLLFPNSSALVDAIVKFVRSPVETAGEKVERDYVGNQGTAVAEGMKRCDPKARLVVHTTKNYHRPDGNTFDVFGRVMSGTIRRGQIVKVLGEKYCLDDDEDSLVRDVSHLHIFQSRYRVEVDEVPAGNWVLISGVDPSIRKTATIVALHGDEDDDDDVEIFSPPQFPIECVVRVACEPLNPSELPKMLEGLRKIAKSYPLLKTRVEDSGEHVIMTTGELAADCALHDLRKLYGDLEIRVADPVVSVTETVLESSVMKASAETANKQNKLWMSCEPLDASLGLDIERGLISASTPVRQLASYLKEKYSYDTLAARSVWAFSSDRGPNMLLNDILPSQESVNEYSTRKGVECVKDVIVHGFQWATREGPLLEEPMRNVQVKLLDATIAAAPIQRNAGQIIPTARRVTYSAMLLAQPRLMEPMFFAEIVCSADCVPAVLNVLQRRRGHMGKDVPNPGTPLEIVYAYLPGLDTFGFETDIRTHTNGMAFVQSCFHSWELMPGDPLDSSIILKPLEASPAPHLARELLLKTRRRKGLAEDVSVQKYFDQDMFAELAKMSAD